MSFPNESEENTSQTEYNLDIPHLASAQPLENEARRTDLSSDEVPGKRPRQKVLLIIQFALLGCIILTLLYTVFHPNEAMPPSADNQTAPISTAQETSTVRSGNATAVSLETVVPHISPQAIYQTYTQGKPLFRDTLTDFNNTYFYDPSTMKPGPGCVFQKDGLHIISSEVGGWVPCNNSAFPDLMSFSFQYDFSILKGNGAGLRFRAAGTTSYYFSIDVSGKYQFIYYPDVTNGKTAQTIQAGNSNAMQKGYGVKNQLTLIAIGDLFYFYLNQKCFLQATDQMLTTGGLSLLVDSETAPTEAVFSQAVAWNIAGMAP